MEIISNFKINEKKIIAAWVLIAAISVVYLFLDERRYSATIRIIYSDMNMFYINKYAKRIKLENYFYDRNNFNEWLNQSKKVSTLKDKEIFFQDFLAKNSSISSNDKTKRIAKFIKNRKELLIASKDLDTINFIYEYLNYSIQKINDEYLKSLNEREEMLNSMFDQISKKSGLKDIAVQGPMVNINNLIREIIRTKYVIKEFDNVKLISSEPPSAPELVPGFYRKVLIVLILSAISGLLNIRLINLDRDRKNLS